MEVKSPNIYIYKKAVSLTTRTINQPFALSTSRSLPPHLQSPITAWLTGKQGKWSSGAGLASRQKGDLLVPPPQPQALGNRSHVAIEEPWWTEVSGSGAGRGRNSDLFVPLPRPTGSGEQEPCCNRGTTVNQGVAAGTSEQAEDGLGTLTVHDFAHAGPLV